METWIGSLCGIKRIILKSLQLNWHKVDYLWVMLAAKSSKKRHFKAKKHYNTENWDESFRLVLLKKTMILPLQCKINFLVRYLHFPHSHLVRFVYFLHSCYHNRHHLFFQLPQVPLCLFYCSAIKCLLRMPPENSKEAHWWVCWSPCNMAIKHTELRIYNSPITSMPTNKSGNACYYVY